MEELVQLFTLVVSPLVSTVITGAVFAVTVIFVARKMGVKL